MAAENHAYNWIAGPTYLCRRRLVFQLLDRAGPGRILEIGFGGGDLIERLSAKGYRGSGIDFSADACRALLARHEGKRLNFRIHTMPEADLARWTERFDIVIALEVLEHIERDTEALRRWFNLVEPGGHLLLSVPAHAGKYGPEDHAAGHFRRYERSDLIEKLAEAGFAVLTCYCYGYPITNLARKVRNHFASTRGDRQATPEERSMEIGKGLIYWRPGKYLFNDLTLFPAYLLQRLFLASDVGDGYLVLAKRSDR